MATAPAPTYSPLYRQLFVGREAELNQLQSGFDGAMSGQGSLAMVVGEPGIGKTALCEQLSTYVTLRGGRTLVGHCYEEGSLSLPYLGFVEALRSYVLSRDVDDLRKELGTGAADVARIVPEIRERLDVELRPPGDPEEERYRLLQGVTDFLANAGRVQPLLVVLEDLHDADKGTLEMLTYVSRHLTGARLFIVGTYRDVEVDRAHPLSGALAELRRVSTYARITLRGLTADEVHRMLGSITGEDVPSGLAEAVHRQTEGNPLFVQEVVRYLVEEGLITREEGRWRTARDMKLEMSMPEGLRDVIGKRLSRLSPECNRLLSTAAVIGREFRLDVLQKVANLAEEELFPALEEAKRTAVLEERSWVAATVTYRFTHAFFRQTLYEEMIAPQRIRLHQQVAQALEALYATRLEQHGAELAEHFSHSSDPADLAKAVSYGEMGAEGAMAVYAYGEAARLLEQALKVQEVLDPDDKAKRCDLLLALGDILSLAGESQRALDNELAEAFSIAEAIADNERALRASQSAIEALIYSTAGTLRMWAFEQAIRWVERADRYAIAGTIDRARVDLALGCVKWSTGQREEGISLLCEALSAARQLGDSETFCMNATLWLGLCVVPQLVEERLRVAEELERHLHTGVPLHVAAHGAFWVLGHAFLEHGQRQRAEACFRELKAVAERTAQVNTRLWAMAWDAAVAYMDGDLVEASRTAEHLQAVGEEFDVGIGATGARWFTVTRALMHMGMYDEVLETTSRMRSIRALCYANLGQTARATQMLDEMLSRRPNIGTPDDNAMYWADAVWLEAAVLVGHRKACELLLRQLAGRSPKTTGAFLKTCIARHLGAACAFLNRPDEARKYYEEAIEVCTEMRFRPELALTRLQLAELLLEHYPDEQPEALDHLEFAISEFRDMKMQPSLERALRHKELLGV